MVTPVCMLSITGCVFFFEYSIAYPPPDSSVRAFFIKHLDGSDETLQFRYSCFLVALFEIGAEELQEVSSGISTERSLAMCWRDFLAQGLELRNVGINRHNFYSKVIKKAEGVSCTCVLGQNWYSLKHPLDNFREFEIHRSIKPALLLPALY